VLHSAVDRGSAALRRGRGAVTATVAASGQDPVPGATAAGLRGRRQEDRPAGGSALRRTIAAQPALRAEFAARGRASGLVIGVFVAVVLPAWTGFDLLLEPAHALRFGLVRTGCTLLVLVALWLLWRRPVGLRHPELLTSAVLTVVQLDIAWMVTQVGDVVPYVMGLSLALYGSGCLLAAPPRWTGGLVVLTWAALAGAVVLAQRPVPPRELAIAAFYLGTASLIATTAHVVRQMLADRELRARLGLQREQERTAALLSRLERRSSEDPLTGLANRRAWDAALSAACTTARSAGTGVAVVLLDIDHFKRVNDRHGHAGGDEALRQVAAVLGGSVRAGDVVARLGGDELGLLLPGADLARATALAESVRRRTRELRPEGFAAGELTVSLGVGTATGAAAYPIDLVSRADAQLYRAKITRDAVAAPTGDPLSRSAAR
jgi:diguanylate cyclase (GGDEF)-like protein